MELTDKQLWQLLWALKYCRTQATSDISTIYSDDIKTDEEAKQQIDDIDTLLELLYKALDI